MSSAWDIGAEKWMSSIFFQSLRRWKHSLSALRALNTFNEVEEKSAEDEIEEKKGIKCDKDVMKIDVYKERQPFRIWHGLFISPPVLLCSNFPRRSWIEWEIFQCCIIVLNFHTRKKRRKKLWIFDPKSINILYQQSLALCRSHCVLHLSFLPCHNQYNWSQGEGKKFALPLIFQDISSHLSFVLALRAPVMASF